MFEFEEKSRGLVLYPSLTEEKARELKSAALFDAFPNLRREAWEDIKAGSLDAIGTDWVEARIQILMKIGDNLWKDLLAWYMWKSQNYNVNARNRQRAIEFGIRLARLEISGATVAKIVATRIINDEHHHTELYWLPETRRFVDWLLDEIGSRQGPYSQTTWLKTQRAIDLIVHHSDTTFLFLLKNLTTAHESKRLQPDYTDGDCDCFTAGRNLGVLKTAIDLLEAADNAQTDLSKVAQYITTKAGLKGDAVLSLECPPRVAMTAAVPAMANVQVLLSLSTPDRDWGIMADWLRKERQQIQPSLHVIGYGWVDGELYSHRDSLNRKRIANHYPIIMEESVPELYPNPGVVLWEWPVGLARGTNRLQFKWWTFPKDSTQPVTLAKLTRYIELVRPVFLGAPVVGSDIIQATFDKIAKHPDVDDAKLEHYRAVCRAVPQWWSHQYLAQVLIHALESHQWVEVCEALDLIIDDATVDEVATRNWQPIQDIYTNILHL